MSAHSVLVGAADPEAVEITVSSATVDLTTCSAASASVVPPGGGDAATWALTIEGTPTETSMVLRHVFAPDGSDVQRVGTYKIRITLTFPASVTRRVRSVSLVVEAW